MVDLFIAGQQAELDSSVTFALNKYFEDTTDPANIYSEWSKTVTIPRTVRNNQIFGSLWSPDRVTSVSQTSAFGLYFDPYKRVDMRIERNGSILLQGYLKVLSVTQKGYQCTLNGELGKIIQELNSITFDLSAEEDRYIIRSSWSETLDRRLIKKAWTEQQTVVGWTPLNIRTDDSTLNQKTFEKAGSIVKFEDTLGSDFQNSAQISPSSAIPDGMMPREIGEFRSYLQQPYLTMNTLFGSVWTKCLQLTGYNFYLDASWFNDSNPYWKKCVMLLDNYNANKDTFVTNTYKAYLLSVAWNGAFATQKDITINPSAVSEAVPVYDNTTKQFNITQPNATASIASKICLYKYDRTTTKEEVRFTDLAKDNALIVWFRWKNADGMTNGSISSFVIANPDCTIMDEVRISNPKAVFLTSSDEMNINMWTDASAGKVQLVGFAKWWNNNAPVRLGANQYLYLAWGDFNSSTRIPYPMQMNIYSNYARSGSTVTLNSLWDNNHTPWEIILDYCKMFRIGIFVDEAGKRLKFIPYTTYFKEYTVSDWTDKIDRSQDFEVRPVTFENRYILFNYENNETSINTEYKKKYKFQYGEKSLITAYQFNTKTKKLFNSIKMPIENTDNVLSWSNLYDNKRVAYSFPAEKYVYAKDDDDRLTDNFGTFYFDEGIVPFDTEEQLNLRSVSVSDDTDLQRSTSTYAYSQYSDRLSCTTYDQLSVFDGNCMMTFNPPQESWSYQSYSGKKGIYELFWESYINERYNTRNKTVTCYAKLTQSDYATFEFNHFVMIDNQLYMVNKIFDYDPESPLTKIELITIQNIKAYTTNNFETSNL